jgi:hypothetical protein
MVRILDPYQFLENMHGAYLGRIGYESSNAIEVA